MDLKGLEDIKLNVRVVLAEREMTLKEILNLDVNSMIGFLNKANGIVPLYVNNKKIAEGYVVVDNNGNIGLRIVNVINNMNADADNRDNFADELVKLLSQTINGMIGVGFEFNKIKEKKKIKGLRYKIGKHEIVFSCEFATKISDMFIGGEGEELSECNDDVKDNLNEIVSVIVGSINHKNKNDEIEFVNPDGGTFECDEYFVYESNKVAFGLK